MPRQTNDVLANKIDNLEKRVSGLNAKVDKIADKMEAQAEINRTEHGTLFKSITELRTTINIATRVVLGFIVVVGGLLAMYINFTAAMD